MAVGAMSCGAETAADRKPTSDGDTTPAEGNSARIMPTVSRRGDSVDILSFAADAFDRAPQLSLDSAPLAATAGIAGSRDFDLTYVNSVRLLSDNRMVAFASIGARVLLFGADGKEERTIGRQGKGPGEFMRPGGVLVLPGDTLFLTDFPNNRLNWVMPDGRFVRTSMMEWERPARGAQRLAGMLVGGRVVLTSAGIVSWKESDTVFRSLASVVVQPFAGAGREIATVPDLAEVTVSVRLRGRDQRENMVLRFTPWAHVAVWDSLIVTSASDTYQITMRTPTGTVLRELRTPLSKRPVTATMTERALRAELEHIESAVGEGGTDVLSKAERRNAARLTPIADSVPVISGIIVASNGTLWVLDMSAASGDEGTFATAYAPDGAMIGRLAIPSDASPVAFGADRVVLRTRDADDVVSLRVHRIVSTKRAP